MFVWMPGTEFQENQRMVLVHRNGIGSPWKPLDTSVDDNNALSASGFTAFGDIAIATYDASIPTTIALFENQGNGFLKTKKMIKIR